MRKASLVQTTIWETDFTSRSIQARLTYLMLITQPTVMTTGMLAIAEKRWTRYTDGDLAASLAELEEHRFVWIDRDHEELVVRSWVKHNVAGSPKMVKAARDQLGAITSERLRGLLVAEYPDVFDTPSHTPSHGVSDTPSHTPSSDTPSDTPSHTQSDSTWSEVRGPRPVEPVVPESRNRRARKQRNGQPTHDGHREAPTLRPQLAKLLDTKVVNELKPGQVEVINRAWETGPELRHSLADIEKADNPAAMLVSVAKRIVPADDLHPAERTAIANSKHAAAVARCKQLYHDATTNEGDDPQVAYDWLLNEYRHDPSIVTEAITTPTPSREDVEL